MVVLNCLGHVGALQRLLCGAELDYTVITEWDSVEALVGLPLNMDGSESTMARRARKLADTLAHRTGCDVITSDERLSSWSADRQDASTPGSDLHQESACRIIETWLRSIGHQK